MENPNSRDDPNQELTARLESMMTGFFIKLTEVLKNSYGSTSGVGPSRTQAKRNIANDNDVIDTEYVPQGGEGDKVSYLKEFN